MEAVAVVVWPLRSHGLAGDAIATTLVARRGAGMTNVWSPAVAWFLRLYRKAIIVVLEYDLEYAGIPRISIPSPSLYLEARCRR
jgi:hypothetical protein